MARKNVLLPQLIATGQSLAASFTSVPTVINFDDNIAYQIDVNTTNSVGTFAVQASLDYVPASPTQNAVAGHWINLTLSGSPSVASTNDDIIIDLNQLPYSAVRIAYTSTVAGTGTCEIRIMAKQVGG